MRGKTSFRVSFGSITGLAAVVTSVAYSLKRSCVMLLGWSGYFVGLGIRVHFENSGLDKRNFGSYLQIHQNPDPAINLKE
jgi:hypothetical protein